MDYSLDGIRRLWLEFGQKISSTGLEELRPAGYFQRNPNSSKINDDLTLFARYLAEPSSRGQFEQFERDYGAAVVSFCKLVSAIVSKSDAKLQPEAATVLCQALTNWLEQSSGAGIEKCTTAGSLHVEAAFALSQLFTQHYAQISAVARSHAVARLCSLVQMGPAVLPQGGWRADCGSQQRHALQALATAASAKSGSELAGEQAALVGQSIVGLLQGITRPGTKLVEDVVHCDFYCVLLRTLNVIILEAKNAWPSLAGQIAEGLSRFMLYGLQPKGLPGPGPGPPVPGSQAWQRSAGGPAAPSHPEARSAGSADRSGGRGSYCPPHRRRRNSHSSASDMSDSDTSDSETGQTSDKQRLAKVRLQMLTCLQSMAKTQPKALHPHWTTVLPVYQPLQPRPLSPHVITMMLFDPVSKVRSMAAATISVLLEGTAQRGFLAVAEAKSVVRPAMRGFTTLSTSLGQLCLSVHTGLLHSLKHEVHVPSLTLVLRALGTFMAAAPFERLPDGLLQEAAQAVHARWCSVKPVVKGEDSAALHSAVLSCLASAFSTRAASQKMREWLLGTQRLSGELRDLKVAQLSPQSRAGPATVMEELLAGAEHSSPILRMEALAALKGLATMYTDRLAGTWPILFSITKHNLQLSLPSSSFPAQPINQPSPNTGNSPQDKAVHHAIKLLGAYLAAYSPARQGSDPTDPDERSTSLSHITTPLSTGSAATSASINNTASANTNNATAAASAHDAILPINSHSATPAIITGQASLSTPTSAVTGPSTIADMNSVHSMWAETCDLLLEMAVCHTSYMVRSAGFGVCSDAPDSALRSLPASTRERLVTVSAAAAVHDAAPAVRSAACRVLGVLCEFEHCVEGRAAGVEEWEVLQRALRDPTMSVKAAAAAAVANLAAAYRLSFAEGVLAGKGVSLAQLRAVQRLASLVITAAQGVEKVRCHGVRALGQLLVFVQPPWLEEDNNNIPQPSPISHNQAPVPDPQPHPMQSHDPIHPIQSHSPIHLIQSHSPIHLIQLHNSIHASSDSGGAQRSTPGPSSGTDNRASWPDICTSSSSQVDLNGKAGVCDGSLCGVAGACKWETTPSLGSALECLQSGLASSSMKVQWNAALAAAGLLSNPHLRATPALSSHLQSLLLLLLILLKDSNNFKIRTHAALALTHADRATLDRVYPDVVMTTLRALEGLKTGGGGGNEGSTTGGSQTVQDPGAAGGLGVDGGSDLNFPNYRYTASLSAQLKSLLLHLLGMLQESDRPRLHDALARKKDKIQAIIDESLVTATVLSDSSDSLSKLSSPRPQDSGWSPQDSSSEAFASQCTIQAGPGSSSVAACSRRADVAHDASDNRNLARSVVEHALWLPDLDHTHGCVNQGRQRGSVEELQARSQQFSQVAEGYDSDVHGLAVGEDTGVENNARESCQCSSQEGLQGEQPQLRKASSVAVSSKGREADEQTNVLKAVQLTIGEQAANGLELLLG